MATQVLAFLSCTYFFLWYMGMIGGISSILAGDFSAPPPVPAPLSNKFASKTTTAIIYYEDVVSLSEHGLIQPHQISQIWQFFNSVPRNKILLSQPADPNASTPDTEPVRAPTIRIGGHRPAAPEQKSWWKGIAIYFTIANVMYLLGALIVAGAMTFFMTQGFNLFGGWAMCLLAILYCVIFILVGNALLGAGKKVPSALFYMLAIFTTPLFTYGIQYSFRSISADEYNSFFAWTHTHHKNAIWIPVELTTLIASAVATWHLPSPFIMIPSWLVLILLTRDLPQILPSDWKALKLLLSFSVSLSILALTYFFEFIGLPTSVDFGMGFLPDSSTWGYMAFVTSLQFSLSTAGKVSLRQAARELTDVTWSMCVLVVLYHLVFEGTVFEFIPVGLFLLGLLHLSLALPRFIANAPLILFTDGFVTMLDGVLTILAPNYLHLISPIFLCLIMFRPLMLLGGLVMVASGAMVFAKHCQGVFAPIAIQLSISLFPCALLMQTTFWAGISRALMLEFGSLVAVATFFSLFYDRKVSNKIHFLVFGSLGSTFCVLAEFLGRSHPLLMQYPFLQFPLFIEASWALGLLNIWIAFHLLENHWTFPIKAALGWLIPSTLIWIKFKFYPILFVQSFSLWFFVSDFPQYYLSVTRTHFSFSIRYHTYLQNSLSAAFPLGLGIIIFAFSYYSMNFQNIFELDTSALWFFYIFSGIMNMISGFVLLFLDGDFFSFTSANASLQFTILAISNIVLFFFFPESWFHPFYCFGILCCQIHTSAIHAGYHFSSIEGILVNFIGGAIGLLISYGIRYYGQWSFFSSIEFEFQSLLGILFAALDLHSMTMRNMPKGAIPGILTFAFVAMAMLLLSSFYSPSRGYMEYLVGVVLSLASYDLAVTRRQHVQSHPALTTLARTGVWASGLVLMLVSPSLENIFLFFTGMAVSLFPISKFLLSQSAGNIFIALLLTLGFITTGVMLQSKLIVVLGGIYVFLGINLLASVIFPASILFPFVLSFCGFAFIYAGMKFDNDSFMQLFKLEHFGAESHGVINEWTTIAVEFFGGKKILA